MPSRAASAVDPRSPAFRDPLAAMFARGRIGEAQFRAGQEFRRLVALANMGPAHNSAAAEALAKSYRALGADGSALVRAMLIDGLTSKQIAEARGLKGPDWQRYYARRFFEALNTLAEVALIGEYQFRRPSC